ncbi:hypothetical protein BN2497_5935 [Janthinobacterium sp. CG23_2]|nr:hypothetical protein BN2497_5935 [Janthinobacterium sp. CG23_2]CUU29365.1 hypothetical protein BN3177_5935 [Janthinobacterium sp. CG23_2]
MKPIFIIPALLFSYSCAAHAQELPPPLKNLMESNAIGDQIVKSDSLSADQRIFMWQDTVRDKDGYLRVDATQKYIEIISEFSGHIQTNPSVKASSEKFLSLTASGWKFIGEVKEDANRTSFGFAWEGIPALMLTEWNYAKAGARVVRVDDFINTEVEGHLGTLTLALSKNMVQCLWKMTWLRDGKRFELYLADILNAENRPSRRPADIVAIAVRLNMELK